MTNLFKLFISDTNKLKITDIYLHQLTSTHTAHNQKCQLMSTFISDSNISKCLPKAVFFNSLKVIFSSICSLFITLELE